MNEEDYTSFDVSLKLAFSKFKCSSNAWWIVGYAFTPSWNGEARELKTVLCVGDRHEKWHRKIGAPYLSIPAYTVRDLLLHQSILSNKLPDYLAGKILRGEEL